jgi:hypothetical protein
MGLGDHKDASGEDPRSSPPGPSIFARTVVKMGVIRWCVFVLLGFMALPVYAFYIHLHGVVTEYATGEGMKGVQVRLVKDSVERETVITPWNGTYELYLERGYDYIVWFHREDLVTKHVRIDAREIPLRPDVPFYDMDVQVTMFTWIEGFDFSIFDQPVGMAEYKHSVRNLNWDIDYTERLRPEVARVMTHYEREVAARQKTAVRQGSTAKRRGGRKRVYF